MPTPSLHRKHEGAKKKLAKIKFAYDRLPHTIRKTVRLLNANTEELKFSNGSNVSVGTGYRGDTPQILLVSEYGKISVDRPDVAKEIRNGAFPAVGKNGKIFVEATAHGTSGEFYDLVERAKAAEKTGLPLTQLDFKLHFFAWWMDRSSTKTTATRSSSIAITRSASSARRSGHLQVGNRNGERTR